MKKKKNKFYNLFVPSSSNNYRAKILHLPSLVVLVFLFLLSQTGTALIALSRPAVLGYSSQITLERIVELTNQERTKMGLNGLTMNKDLNEAARRKAADMFVFDYWSHNSPTGRDPWSFFREVGYDYLYAGENLARDFSSAEAVVSAWMASPTHRDNLINDQYLEIGVAVVEGELGGMQTTLVVQMFGASSKTVASESSDEANGLIEAASILAEQGGSSQAGSQQETLFQAEEGLAHQNRTELVNPLTISKAIAVFVLSLLIVALLIDRLVVSRKGISRLAGNNWTHLGFLVVILLLVLLSQPGTILRSISSL